MGSITDYTLPNVRWSLEENQRLLASHRQACRPCRTRKPSKPAWCPYGWQLAGAQRQLQVMVRRMEAIQLEDRQPSLFDDPQERAAAALTTPTTALDPNPTQPDGDPWTP